MSGHNAFKHLVSYRFYNRHIHLKTRVYSMPAYILRAHRQCGICALESSSCEYLVTQNIFTNISISLGAKFLHT